MKKKYYHPELEASEALSKNIFCLNLSTTGENAMLDENDLDNIPKD